MNILMTGGTGFVGKHLTEEIVNKGHNVYILSRSPEKHTQTGYTSFIDYNTKADELPSIDAVINLAGDSLFGYWTNRKKEKIKSSRIETTQHVIDLITEMESKPAVFISGSAIGYYGTSEDFIFTEKTTQSGNDFLAEVVSEWEKTAQQAEQSGIRTVYTRFGIILGKEGALPLMKRPIKLFAGGKIGSGEQWLSWVHIKDVVGLIQFCLFNKDISGPVNVTAPSPTRNKEFTKVLSAVLKRPYWIPAPGIMIRTAIGEMSLLITEGQYVLPRKAQKYDYQFAFPYLEAALRETERP